jgi:isoprenylcysteine carboxyl methyltransferase (ICMT) family protein YpbQ
VNAESTILISLAIHLFSRLGEFFQHETNRKFLEFIGAKSPDASLNIAFHGISLLSILVMVAGAMVDPILVSRNFAIVIIGLLLINQLLRFWCISLQGRYWSLTFHTIDGLEPVSSGPYRWFSHPEIFTRFFDVVLFMILCRSTVLGPIAVTVVFVSALHISSRQNRFLSHRRRISPE